jgi:hypothetical protein
MKYAGATSLGVAVNVRECGKEVDVIKETGLVNAA